MKLGMIEQQEQRELFRIRELPAGAQGPQNIPVVLVLQGLEILRNLTNPHCIFKTVQLFDAEAFLHAFSGRSVRHYLGHPPREGVQDFVHFH